jgi:hypothetical protein
MLIGALSRMRLEEIGQLRVGNCKDSVFTITRIKSAAGVRTLPIHSIIRPTITQLAGTRHAKSYLFPDLPDTGWDDNRTMAISKRLGYYRKTIGVDDKRLGARRSKVNFHSGDGSPQRLRMPETERMWLLISWARKSRRYHVWPVCKRAEETAKNQSASSP